MHKPVHEQAAELLLDSMSQRLVDGGLSHSFFFGKPGAPHWQRSGGTEIFYQSTKLVRASLYVRQHGPAYLKYLSVDDISSRLKSFVVSSYWHLAHDAFGNWFDGSYAANISRPAKLSFAAALSASEIFQPNDDLTLFPIIPLRVESDFESSPFFLIAPSSLNAAKLPSGVDMRTVSAETFPPLSDWKGRKQASSAWLGVRSPALQSSNKMKSAILGALALTPLPRYRYRFSGRQMFGGCCTFSATGTTTTSSPSSLSEGHTPPLMDDIVVSHKDTEWLSVLATKLSANERTVRRQLRALEYFYRAWPLEPSERFPILCMTLDAIFGDANHATRAVIDGVRALIGTHVREARLRHLMELRASVIHGGAPDVYDSRKYGKYYDEYEADPIHDMELVVANCLRLQIFGNALKEHADPHAKIISELQAAGRIQWKPLRKTILEDSPE